MGEGEERGIHVVAVVAVAGEILSVRLTRYAYPRRSGERARLVRVVEKATTSSAAPVA